MLACIIGASHEAVIGDDTVDPNKVERVLLCSGKITWDLVTERKKREGDEDRTAIVRVEQLYPRPLEELNAELAKFPNATELRWVQDEPENQGPWPHVALYVRDRLNLPMTHVTRPESSAPSVGSHAAHVAEHKDLMNRAFE